MLTAKKEEKDYEKVIIQLSKDRNARLSLFHCLLLLLAVRDLEVDHENMRKKSGGRRELRTVDSGEGQSPAFKH